MGASGKVVHVILTLLSREKTNFGERVFVGERVRGSPLLTSQFVGWCKSGVDDLLDHTGDLVQGSLNA